MGLEADKALCKESSGRTVEQQLEADLKNPGRDRNIPRLNGGLVSFL